MLFLPSPAEPLFKLMYKGIDISSEVRPHLISCTYTDKVHGEADEIDVTVQDKDGLWRGAWCPEHGDQVSVWIGYKPDWLVPCGDFEIDEPNARIGRGGDTLTFRGVSAPITKSLRTKKTRGFEDQSIRDVAGKIAGEHGLTVTGTPPDVRFKRITQRRERDLEFLSRLAENYGAYFTVKGKRLVFAKRDEVHSRAAVVSVQVTSQGFISADLKGQSHKTYSKAKLTHFEGQEKRTIEAEASDGNVKNGDTLRIDDRVENDGQAKARVKSELQKENLKRQTGTLEWTGNPLLLAGQMIELGSSFGKWAGRFVIKSSRHAISREGYTTSCEINGVGG